MQREGGGAAATRAFGAWVRTNRWSSSLNPHTERKRAAPQDGPLPNFPTDHPRGRLRIMKVSKVYSAT
jgi:hypothetical protein